MILEKINDCYTFKHYQYDNVIFPFIDMAYLLHIDNPKYYYRLQNSLHQFKKYKPCKNLIVVLNKTFKRCSKKKIY